MIDELIAAIERDKRDADYWAFSFPQEKWRQLAAELRAMQEPKKLDPPSQAQRDEFERQRRITKHWATVGPKLLKFCKWVQGAIQRAGSEEQLGELISDVPGSLRALIAEAEATP